jgi:fermentation-respiration switch protein FrsA (DUF1100 family)
LKIAVILLFLWGVLRWFEHHQVYHPSRSFDTTGQELGRPVEDVWIETADGVRLHAWFFPASDDSLRKDRAWLLLHGNAGNISHRLLHASLLLQTGGSALLLDYRGYGRSAGRPSEAGTYLDAEAAYAWLKTRGFQSTNIFLLGESLGGGVAAELALRHPVGGLALLSSFTSIPDAGAELLPWFPVRLLATIQYDTRAKLPAIRVPVLILHGRTDSLIGFHHAQNNYAAANEPKRLVELDGDHNDLPHSDARTYREALENLLSSNLP